MPRRLRPAVMVVILVATAGCGGAETPAVPVAADGSVDPVLERGRELYASQCATCHGDDGKGRTGPVLAGRVVAEYPDIADQIEVVVSGRQAMPAFGVQLSADDIEAVVRYTREVL